MEMVFLLFFHGIGIVIKKTLRLPLSRLGNSETALGFLFCVAVLLAAVEIFRAI